jgi:hypothetical protein
MFSGKFIKKDGKLIFDHPKDKLAYEMFVEKLEEGQVVDMYIDLARMQITVKHNLQKYMLV